MATPDFGLQLQLVPDLYNAAQAVDASRRRSGYSQLVVELLLAMIRYRIAHHFGNNKTLASYVGSCQVLRLVVDQHEQPDLDALHSYVTVVCGQYADRYRLARHKSGLRERQLQLQRLRLTRPTPVGFLSFNLRGHL